MLPRRHFLRTLAAAVASPLGALRAEPSSDVRVVVERGAWGSAPPVDIAKVAAGTAAELWRWCPHTRMDGIRIYHRKDWPQTDFGRGPDGRIAIGLAAENPRWSQFAFQFAHEFCHALAQHSETGMRGWHEPRHANLWLEECLCETASLFALRCLAETWRARPPYRNWRSFAPAHASYAAERLAEPQHQLPAGQSFREWFVQNENALRTNAALREKNVIVARQFLPLFEAAPENWEAVTFLNHGPRVKAKLLAAKFADWQAAAPPVHRAFIARLGGVFGV
ncbi:MAG: hypothetical protein K8R23_08800 [Chthoniobacter sp.]|nr:hypothetical protein [Chthoniobacter sp.]